MRNPLMRVAAAHADHPLTEDRSADKGVAP
jgi:hypothetical protein